MDNKILCLFYRFSNKLLLGILSKIHYIPYNPKRYFSVIVLNEAFFTTTNISTAIAIDITKSSPPPQLVWVLFITLDLKAV